jgi:methylase of polypeptide subunit release factors
VSSIDQSVPWFCSDEDFRRLRDVLDCAGYTEDGIREVIGSANMLSVPAMDMPRCLRCTRGLSPRETLIRLFLLNLDVTEGALREAAAPMTVPEWEAAGLIERRAGAREVVPRIQLMPVEGLLLAADGARQEATAARSDFVMPPGNITLQLAYATIPHRGGLTLDLGTGCGPLALLAARQSERVIATDKNARAAAFTHFNARLNGAANVHVCAGDLFEPVAKSRFNLIVSNPPFVIGPTRRYLFRDSGGAGDEFCRALIRAVPTLLEPDGYCQLMCNFPHEEGRPWPGGLAEWFDGLGCDVLVWVQRTEKISDYAMTWIISTESRDVEKVPRLYDEWMNYFEERRIEAVSYVLVTMRRREDGRGWTDIDDTTRQIVGPCGDQVKRCFAIREFLERTPSEQALLDTRFRLAPEAAIHQEHRMTSDGLAITGATVRLVRGVHYVLNTDLHVAGLVARCDGQHRLGALASQMADGMAIGRERVFPAVVKAVRELAQRGILLPEGL